MSKLTPSTNPISTAKAGAELLEWTVEQVVTDLYLEIAILARVNSDSAAHGMTIKQLLIRDEDNADGAIRHVFRSPFTPDYLMEALELDDLGELEDKLKLDLELAINESIELEVFTVWVDDLRDILFRLKP